MTEMNAMTMENATATMAENRSEGQAAQFEMVEQLAVKMGIPLAEAKAALEAADWNKLTATHLLEQEAFLRKQALDEAVESCAVSDRPTQVNATAGKAHTARKKPVTKPKRFFSSLCDHLRRLMAFGNHNRFTVAKDGDRLLEMPVTALALLLLFSFGTCALLMVVGLFAGCRYMVTPVAEV